MKNRACCSFGQVAVVCSSEGEKSAYDAPVVMGKKKVYIGSNFTVSWTDVGKVKVFDQSMIFEDHKDGQDRTIHFEGPNLDSWKVFKAAVLRRQAEYSMDTEGGTAKSAIKRRSPNKTGARRKPKIHGGGKRGSLSGNNTTHGDWSDDEVLQKVPGGNHEPAAPMRPVEDEMDAKVRNVQQAYDDVDEMPKRQRKRLRRVSAPALEDSDDDDEPFLADGEMTTPAEAQRVVSPADNTEKESGTKAAAKEQQPTISNFFHPRTNAGSAHDRKLPLNNHLKTPLPSRKGQVVKGVTPSSSNRTRGKVATSIVHTSPRMHRQRMDWVHTDRPETASKQSPSPRRPHAHVPDDGDGKERPQLTPVSPMPSDDGRPFTSRQERRKQFEQNFDDVRDSAEHDDSDESRTEKAGETTPEMKSCEMSPNPRTPPRFTPTSKYRYSGDRGTLTTAIKPRGFDLNHRFNRPLLPMHSEKVDDIGSYTGLKNLGNTCYLNSSLQMLFTVRGFMEKLKSKGEGQLVKSLLSVAEYVNSGINERGIRGPASTKAVKIAMDAKTDKFRGFEQRDAHEFLGDLIDQIHDEITLEKEERADNAVKNTSTVTAATTDFDRELPDEEMKQPATPAGSDAASNGQATDAAVEQGGKSETAASTNMTTTKVVLPKEAKAFGASSSTNADLLPTDEYFRCDMEVCLRCTSCGYTRTKNEMYRHLSLDIPNLESFGENDASVQRSLEAFFMPEERDLKCEKCEEGKTASQTLRLLARPKALLLHLKRFVYEEKPVEEKENQPDNGPQAMEITFRKNKARIVLSESVSLDEFMSSESRIDTPGAASGKDYSIKSLVYHIGARASSGHYTADSIRENNQEPGKVEWVSFDDSQTSTKSHDEVVNSIHSQRAAYMLLYTMD